jgi:methylmalonyl-CoA/ethylmalonyl-CoA epimerase
MKRIEHLGIAVESLELAIPLYEALLNTACYKQEAVLSEGVKTAFFQVGASKIELLEASLPDSPIAKFIAKNGPGFHHVAFEVENIEAELDRLQKAGFQLIHERPKDGADNKKIAFLHPKATNGLLVEICQEKSA